MSSKFCVAQFKITFNAIIIILIINSFESKLFRCGNRTVTKAYHVCCKDCAKKERCCAKCLTSGDKVNIEPSTPSPHEEQQLKVEMDRLINSLPERKRRTFLRYMQKGREIERTNENESGENDGKKDILTEILFDSHICDLFRCRS